ncbi:MAG: HTTM domain-containing protein [Flavobacteriaceae bacterium]|nr:HTTM domain-containing protein [Flavobacteriaceae bacterium]
MNKFLFKQIDNSSLIVFRIIFGLLIFLESVGAIFTGWVKRTLIDPEFTFTVIGFEWLQPLPGNGMYFYYLIMGICGFFVMIGYKYRWSMIGFTLLWTVTYLMQKASYNNHYYLLILISSFMCIVPANKYLSVDAKLKPEITSYKMPNWAKWIFIAQMALVYTYGAIAKLYPDWLNTSVMKQLMMAKEHYYVVGDLLQQTWVHSILAYGGIAFDGLIIPLLLFKPTRKLAFIAGIFFHMFNAIVFQVGIFPFLSLAFCLFFFEAKTIHNIFLKRKPYYTSDEVIIPKTASTLKPILFMYFCIQLFLPIRHWFIPGDVLRTEEGHRLSWRMMLRTKSGRISYKVVDKETGKAIFIQHYKLVSPKQARLLATKPDVIWQFIQHLKKKYEAEGKSVEIYAINSKISVNGGKHTPFIDPKIDLTTVEWNTFTHSDWILDQRSELKTFTTEK